jgi:hypothetical protein
MSEFQQFSQMYSKEIVFVGLDVRFSENSPIPNGIDPSFHAACSGSSFVQRTG